MIEPGMVLESSTQHPPVVRVICRYPFDHLDAEPRWVVEHINQPGRVVEIADEKLLAYRSVVVKVPIRAELDGGRR